MIFYLFIYLYMLALLYKINLFYFMSRYIYIGELDLTKQSGEDVLGLLVASEELLLEELSKYVKDHLIERKADWVQNNFFLVMKIMFNLTNYQKFYERCILTICENLLLTFYSNDFLSLDKNILLDLLKSVHLKIEEIIAWECLIKWGIEQTPGLGSKNSNRAKWNHKNFEALKETLSQFIPLIRFIAISPADFFDKVRPYQVIFPSHIYEEVTEFYFKDTLPKSTLRPRRPPKLKIDRMERVFHG